MFHREVGFPRRSRRPAVLLTLLALGAGVHWIHGKLAPPVRDYDPVALARAEVRSYALDAYPQWRMRQHTRDRQCPRTIYDLDPYIGREDIFDPWGTAYVLSCDYYADGSVQYVWVRSAGPDRELGTADDLRSHW